MNTEPLYRATLTIVTEEGRCIDTREIYPIMAEHRPHGIEFELLESKMPPQVSEHLTAVRVVIEHINAALEGAVLIDLAQRIFKLAQNVISNDSIIGQLLVSFKGRSRYFQLPFASELTDREREAVKLISDALSEICEEIGLEKTSGA